jgi:hypothetical protein
MSHSRPCWFAIAATSLFLVTHAYLLAHSQDGFAPMAGEIKVRGVLACTADHPQQWLLHLDKPIHLEGKKTTVLEVIEPSPGPARQLQSGDHVEFTGRLKPERNPPFIQVNTISISPTLIDHSESGLTFGQ